MQWKIQTVLLLAILLACSPRPSPEQQAALDKQTMASQAAEARVSTLQAERNALMEELDRERQIQAALDLELQQMERRGK